MEEEERHHTWFAEESHTEIDVVLAVTDVLPAVLQQPHHSLTYHVKEQTWEERERERKRNERLIQRDVQDNASHQLL